MVVGGERWVGTRAVARARYPRRLETRGRVSDIKIMVLFTYEHYGSVFDKIVLLLLSCSCTCWLRVLSVLV